MRWVCPRCQRPLPLAFEECPYCHPESAAGPLPLRVAVSPASPAAARAPQLGSLDDQQPESPLRRSFWKGVGILAAAAFVFFLVAALWWLFSGGADRGR